MENPSLNLSDEIVVTLRRIIRAFDLHSRSLVQTHGLTGPQAAMLKGLALGPLSAGELAARINLSQGTVTDLLIRLESRELLRRVRDEGDKRRVIVTITDKGRGLIQASVPLMQARFAESFASLADWEQAQMLASLQRLAHMMQEGISGPRGPAPGNAFSEAVASAMSSDGGVASEG